MTLSAAKPGGMSSMVRQLLHTHDVARNQEQMGLQLEYLTGADDGHSGLLQNLKLFKQRLQKTVNVLGVTERDNCNLQHVLILVPTHWLV